MRDVYPVGAPLANSPRPGKPTAAGQLAGSQRQRTPNRISNMKTGPSTINSRAQRSGFCSPPANQQHGGFLASVADRERVRPEGCLRVLVASCYFPTLQLPLRVNCNNELTRLFRRWQWKTQATEFKPFHHRALARCPEFLETGPANWWSEIFSSKLALNGFN